MFKRLLMALAMAIPMIGMAQTGFYTDRAVGTFPVPGRGGSVTTLIPIQFGQVRVCTAADIGGIFSPCPDIAVITDTSGNPLTIVGGNFGQIRTDVTGRFSFGCTPTTNYLVQVAASSSNVPQLSYPITCPSASSSGNISAGALVPTTHMDSKPLIQNPDFSEGAGTSILPPPGWGVNSFSINAAIGTATYETGSPAPNKVQSLKWCTTIQNGQLLNAATWIVSPGDFYSINGQVKSDGVGIPVIDVAFRTANFASVSDIQTTGTTSTSWSGAFASGQVPATATIAIVRLFNTATTQPSCVFFDQIRVDKTSWVGTTVSGAFSPTVSDRQPIVANPDFTASSQIIPPPGWFIRGGTPALSYETVTPAPGKSQSLKMVMNDSGGDSIGQNTTFSVFPGDSYTITAMVKSDGTAAPVVFLKSNTGAFFVLTTSTTSTSWTQVTAAGTVPAGATSASLVLAFSNATNGTIWFDQISVQKTNFVGPVSVVPGTGSSNLVPAANPTNGVGLIGDVNQTLGSGTGKIYGVIGVGRAVGDVSGDKAYGGYFVAHASNLPGTEVGVHAEVDSTGSVLNEGVVAGSQKYHIDGIGVFSSSLSQVNTTAVTVNTATTANQTAQSVTIPAGALNVVGRNITIDAGGSFNGFGSTTQTVQVQLVVGPNLGPVLQFVSNPANGASWSFHANCTVTTAGSSGALVCGAVSGLGLVGIATPPATATSFTVSPVNLTTTVVVSTQFSFTVASASNSATSNQLLVVPNN